MRLAVLTTDTLHHAFFLRELQAYYDVGLVLSEQEQLAPPFAVVHDFEAARDAHECVHFFDGCHTSIKDVSEVCDVDSVNSSQAVKVVKGFNPDVVVVFGTGVLRQEIINLCPAGIINLHGGDPERYRGLDSHLWSIYHSDISGFVTTLHRVNCLLDDGEIICQERLSLRADTVLPQLRAINTEACVRLSLAALQDYTQEGCFSSRPQRKKGRYYSFMPTCLKDICVTRFEKLVGGNS